MTVSGDPSLPHQLRLEADVPRGVLYVSCNCMRDRDGQFVPLFPPGGAFDLHRARTAYDAHLKEVNGP